MEDTKSQILSLFHEVMLNTMDTMDNKTLSFWVGSITKGTKSLDDLEAFLLKSQDYHNAVKNTFIDVFYDKIGGNNEYQDLFKAFLQENTSHVRTSKSDIHDYIIQSKMFIDKYATIVGSVYEAVTNGSPEPETTVRYIRKFQELAEYSIDDLKKDIMSDLILGPDDQETTCNHAKNGTSNDDDSVFDGLTEQQITDIKDLWNDKVEFVRFFTRGTADGSVADKEASAVASASATQDFPEDIITAFESIYARSMNAWEYVLYAAQQPTDIVSFLNARKQSHDTAYDRVKELRQVYLDDTIDEADFIRDYLHDIHKPDFLECLKHDILSSDAYKHKMSGRISSLYKTMYDEELLEEDSENIFASVKGKAYELFNEELNGVLVDYKNETDQLTERLYRIFITTYEREPDIHELTTFLRLYRKHPDIDIQEVDAMVEKELVASLEYHDVLKQKIKQSYTDKKHANILPSITFKVLKMVLERLPGLHGQSGQGIDGLISQLIQEL